MIRINDELRGKTAIFLPAYLVENQALAGAGKYLALQTVCIYASLSKRLQCGFLTILALSRHGVNEIRSDAMKLGTLLSKVQMTKASLTVFKSVLMAVMAGTLAHAAAPAPETAASNEIVLRNELAGPLRAAQEQLRKQEFSAALITLAPLQARMDLTPYERFLIEKHVAVAQLKAGAYAQAFEAFEKMLATGATPIGERRELFELMMPWALKEKSFERAAQWSDELFKLYAEAQPPVVPKDNIRLSRIHAHYFAGHYVLAATLCREWIAEQTGAGGKPALNLLELEGSSYLKSKDAKGYVRVLEDLVTSYPKPDYWADLISRAVVGRDDYPSGLDIEVLRFKRVIGAPMDGSEYVDHANLSLQAAYPIEAKIVLDQALAATGNAPSDEAAMRKLLGVAQKQIAEDRKIAATPEKVLASAKDGQPLFNVGLNNVFAGQYEQGLRLMQQGIAKGGLKQPAEARLRLAYASVLADQKPAAMEALKSLESGASGAGSGATAALAHVWMLWLKAPARP
jgi:hypothetical protein